MVSLRPIRLAALALLSIAGLALPAHTTAQVPVSAARVAAAAAYGNDFATSLTGVITGKNHNVIRTVSLTVSRSSDDKTVQLTVTVTNASGRAGSTYTFVVPASDLVIGSAGAGLDTHTHLGKYGHIGVQWTYSPHIPRGSIPGNSCYGQAPSGTRIVASATAQLNLTLPCGDSVDVTLSPTKLDLDSGQNITPRGSSQSAGQSVYYTDVAATKAMGMRKGLLVEGVKMGKSARITVSVYTSSTAATGLIGSDHFAGDSLPLTGLTTGANPAGQVSTTLAYTGTLGSVSLGFAGSGETRTTTESGGCANPDAAKADLSKTVGEQWTQASVTGSVSLTVCGAVKATFGSGDTGTVVAYGSAGATPSAVSGGLPAQGSGDIPDIIRIGPAPGSPPAIAVTFARPLPSHAYLVIMLSGPGGEAALSDPVVRGNSATVTIDSSSPLKPGAYTLKVSATSDSGGHVYYQGTYTVSATPSAGATPAAGGTPPATCGSLHGVTILGTFPNICRISPAPGNPMSRTPTIVVTYAAALPADVQFQIMLVPVDKSGNPTGDAATLSDPVVRGTTVTVKATSPLQPGLYQFNILAHNNSGEATEYQGTYTVS